MPLNHTPVIASRTSLPAVPSDLEALKAEESRLQSLLTEVRTQKLKNLQSKPLRIAVVGFGRFGQFISKTFCKTADVVAVSRSDYSAIAKDMGVEYVPLTDFSSLFGDDKPAIDVVVLSTSILSFERMISQISSAVGDAAGPLVVDVLSVKEHPRRVMLTELPPQCDILCTHPMFGPDSAKNGWGGLNFVYEKTRINGVVDYVSNEDTSPPSNMEYGIDRVERFLSIFEEEGCKMVPLACHDHDTAAANSQFITHLVGRILGRQGLERTPIDTKGFENVVKLIESTTADSFDLFYGLYKYNSNSRDTIFKMKKAFEEVEKELRQMERDDINAPGWGSISLNPRVKGGKRSGGGGGGGRAGSESTLLNFEQVRKEHGEESLI